MRCSAPGSTGRSEWPGARDDRGDQRARRAGRRGRSAERHQRHKRRCDGRGGAGERDRHLLPPQAGPRAVARPAALRAGRGGRHRHSGGRAARRSRRASSPTRRRSGPTNSRCRSRAATNTGAATPWSCPATSRTPAPRGLPRAARCGQGPGSSRSQARARRSPSMPRRASPSWCGRSMARPSSRPARRHAAEHRRARPRRRGGRADARHGAGGARRRPRGRARRRCADQLRRRPRSRCSQPSRPEDRRRPCSRRTRANSRACSIQQHKRLIMRQNAIARGWRPRLPARSSC